MERKLTGNERAFLSQLAELMSEHICIMSTEDNKVFFDIEDIDTIGPIEIPGINAGYDIDDFIKDNS